MTAVEFQNWLSLYAAATVCAVFACTLAVVTVGWEAIRERQWQAADTWQARALLVPRLWWRWQKRYLCALPAFALVLFTYGWTLDL